MLQHFCDKYTINLNKHIIEDYSITNLNYIFCIEYWQLDQRKLISLNLRIYFNFDECLWNLDLMK